MSTPVDGFRRNLEQALPEMIEDCEKKVRAAETALDEQKDALRFVLSVAHGAGVDRAPRKPALAGAAEPNETETETPGHAAA